MTVAAGGYVLNVPAARRTILLDDSESDLQPVPTMVEPVLAFEHSSRVPLVVFAAFEDDRITHIADGRRGQRASGLRLLRMQNLQALKRPISFVDLVAGVPKRFRFHLTRVLREGGILPPKTLGAVVDRILALDSSLAERLARWSDTRRAALGRYQPQERENLALQKEALGLAMEIAGVKRDALLGWSPFEGKRQSYLDGLPGAVVREDVMLLADFDSFPGFFAESGATHLASKTFISEADPDVYLTVTMANRLELEEQIGADLIYLNERYDSFVMVQYKAMEQRNGQAEFRWQPDDQFCDEIARMEVILAELGKIEPGTHPDGYRFSDNPFFLKFCPRVVLNPDDKGLFKGIYLPLDLWKRLEAAGRLKGPKGGNLITFENVGRRINNSEFVGLVSGAWVGTSIEQSGALKKLIREIVSSGKTVTFAVERSVPTLTALSPAHQRGGIPDREDWSVNGDVDGEPDEDPFKPIY